MALSYTGALLAGQGGVAGALSVVLPIAVSFGTIALCRPIRDPARAEAIPRPPDAATPVPPDGAIALTDLAAASGPLAPPGHSLDRPHAAG